MALPQSRQVSTHTTIDIFFKCWELARANYSQSLIITVLVTLSYALGLLSYIGPIAAAIMSASIPPILISAAHHWEHKKNVKISEYLKPLQVFEQRKRILPIILFYAVFNFAFASLTQNELISSSMIFSLVVGFLQFFLSYIFLLSYPLLMFHPELEYKQAMTLARQAVLKNLIPLFLSAILHLLLLILSLLVFVLPVLLFAIPLSISLTYIWYRVFFEGLDLSQPEDSLDELFTEKPPQP
jgi:hypothetical protein